MTPSRHKRQSTDSRIGNRDLVRSGRVSSQSFYELEFISEVPRSRSCFLQSPPAPLVAWRLLSASTRSSTLLMKSLVVGPNVIGINTDQQALIQQWCLVETKRALSFHLPIVDVDDPMYHQEYSVH